MKKQLTLLSISILVFSSMGFFIPLLSSHPVEKTNDLLSNECDCQIQQDSTTTALGYECFVMKHPINCAELSPSKPTRAPATLPAEFSWKDNDGADWTTSAKYQGNCGSCWDFAAVGALESRIKISEGCYQLQPDLSEQYVLSCLPAAANYYGQGCYGGTPYGAYYYIMNTTEEGNNVNGIIPESCFPYQASHDVSCDEKCEDWMDHLVPLTGCNYTYLGLGYATKQNTDVIKTILYEEGPIAVAFNVTSDFINFWSIHHSADEYYPDTHEPWGNQLNHIVVLVGWKDDPSIENGGYWVVKNSWGPDWGYEGFFNLEYYGLYFGMYYATASYDPESVNWAPIADTGGLYAGDIEEVITFDGTQSVDPEGAIESYVWDFGDNTTGNGQKPTHQYSAEGIYMVTLTVTDESGNTGLDSALVGIGQDPVVIDAKGILGVDISIESKVSQTLTNLKWDINFTGLVRASDTCGIIPTLSNQQIFSQKILVFGLGFGTLTINVENIRHTEKFFILGPSVFGLRFQ